jgi:outer membrane biosynthesis protein TonB
MFAASVGVQDGSRRFVRVTVSVSVFLHALAGLGLLGYSFWKISKLTPKTSELVFYGGAPSMGGPPPAAATPKAATPKRVPLQKTHEVVQPTDKTTSPSENPDSASSATAAGTGSGDGTGGPGDGTGTGTGIEGIGPGDGPPQLVPDAVQPPDPPKPPETIAQEMIEGQRIAGTERILLPANVLALLRRDNVSQVQAVARICVDEQGNAASIRFRRPSGYSSVDEVIEREMSKWRYRPWLVKGQAVSACFVVIFNYRITD